MTSSTDRRSAGARPALATRVETSHASCRHTSFQIHASREALQRSLQLLAETGAASIPGSELFVRRGHDPSGGSADGS